MNYTQVLASVLAAEQAKIPNMESVSTQRLRALKDPKIQNTFKKMYTELVNEDDHSAFPAFLQDIDAVFCKHGAGEGEKDSEDNDIDEE